jgi:predicted ATPase
MGIEPNVALRRLEEQILLHELPMEPPEPEALPTHDLPARTSSFIGRDGTIADIDKLIGEQRLVTLNGFAGIGKTSVAIEAARCLMSGYPDGVWLVELAALTDPNSVVDELATVFDIRPHPTRPLLDVVGDELASKSMLLIFDNCEHLLGESARVIDALLARCPTLHVLATSREPLQLSGEQICPVPPLDLPTENDLSVEMAGEIEAVQLFVERARQSQPAFELNDTNVEAVVRICRSLEGIPLAIELAAARLRVLSPLDLLDRLDDQLAVLATGGAARPGRHRTLKAAIEWSHDLLDQPEQTLLRRLAVFSGGFTLAAAEDVCSGDGVERGEVLDLVGHLVEVSLLTVRGGESRRYGMLESVYQYAQDLLEGSGEESALRNRHAAYCADLFRHDPVWGTAEFGELLDQVAIEQDNYVSALDWAIRRGDGDQAVRLAVPLWRHWNHHYSQSEQVFRWLPRVLTVAGATPTLERARVLSGLGASLCSAGRRREAAPIFEELATIAEQLDNAQIWGYAVLNRVFYLTAAGDLRGAHRFYVEQLPTLRNDDTVSLHLSNIVERALELGDYAQAAEAIDEWEEAAATWNQAMELPRVKAFRGILAFHHGDLTTAERLLVEGVGELRRLNLDDSEVYPLSHLAQVALAA